MKSVMKRVMGVMNTTREYMLDELEGRVISSEVRNENNRGLNLFLRVEGHTREIRWFQSDNPVSITAGMRLRGFYKPHTQDNSPYTELSAFELYDEDGNVIFKNISRIGYVFIIEDHATQTRQS